MSRFVYNGVELTFVKTLRFRIEDEKDPSGVDQLWRKYTLSVRGVVSGGASISNGPASLAALQEALTTPRKALFYQMGGTTILNTAGLDARYGPDAPTVEVNEVVEGIIFATVGVTVRVAACATNTGSNEIASLRWSQTEEIDGGEQLTTLVTTGLLISRTDLRNLNADSFREAIPVPVPDKNFTRQAQYRLSEDGTRLSFEFRDREWFKAPPRTAVGYAIEASGTFVVTCPKPGAIRYGAVNLTLKGAPTTPRAMLMAMAFSIAYAKLKRAKPQDDGKGRIIVDYVATEDLYRNVVQLAMRATLSGVSVGQLSPALDALFGDTPGSDNPTSIAPPTRRALAGLLSAAFRDPCATAAARPSQYNSITSTPQQYPPATISQGQVSSLPEQPSPVYKSDRGGYDWYKVEATYRLDEGKGHLPGTGLGPTPNRAKIIKMAGWKMTLEIAWSVRRRGVPPVYPAYQTGDPNLESLRGTWGPIPNVEVGADGTPIWEASGLYLYAVVDPEGVGMVAPRPPYLSELAAQAATQVLKYSDASVSTGGAAVGSAAPGMPPLNAGVAAGAAVGSSLPNPATGANVETQTQPDDSLARQLTAAEQQYVDQVVQAGGDRQSITNAVLGGLAGPLGGGGSAPGQPPAGP